MSDELIIPVRLDSSAAKAGLASVGHAGRQAGDDVNQGMGHGQAGIKSAGAELKAFLVAQAGLGAMKQAASALGDEFKRMSEYIGNTSREFQKFRQSLQGVASLMGQPNTNKFAAAEITRAERAHVTPQESKEFREAFLSKASLYVGAGPEAKLSEKEADEFQDYLSEYAKLKGVSQQEMAGFAGGLLAQQKGKTTAAAMKKQAGEVFATLEASSAPVAHLLPQLTRAQAQGFSAQEGSQVLAMMPEIAPEEEGTYMLRAVSALRERVQKGQGEQFGLKKGMGSYEMLTTAVKNIKDRAAKGEDLEDLIAKATGNEEVSGRAIRGMVGQGPEGFARWRKVMEAVPADQLERTIQEGRKSDAGKQYAVDSAEAVETARLGMRNDELTRRRQIARTELIKGGKFEKPPTWGELGAAQVPWGDKDVKSIQTNLQMLRRARAELGESSGIGDANAALNAGTTDEAMRAMLPKIEKMGFQALAKRREIAAGELEKTGLNLKQDPHRDERINLQALRDARLQAHERAAPTDAAVAKDANATNALLRELIQRVDEQNKMMRDEARNKGQQPAATPRPLVMAPPLTHGPHATGRYA